MAEIRKLEKVLQYTQETNNSSKVTNNTSEMIVSILFVWNIYKNVTLPHVHSTLLNILNQGTLLNIYPIVRGILVAFVKYEILSPYIF